MQSNRSHVVVFPAQHRCVCVENMLFVKLALGTGTFAQTLLDDFADVYSGWCQ